ncbi:hypothetical protein OAC07_04740, partial [Candidatus Pelagibacter sp.]|nr:hypothetical protein [Candidatus Pelagibacter sp.]
FKKNLYYKNTNNLFDERTRLEFYFEINQDKKKIFYLTGPEFVKQNKSEGEKYFLSGISNVNSLQCNENGYYSIIKNDRFGFNNPDTEWSQKKISYLLLGDSFIHGACVNRPNDISSNIRILSKKTVINLGYSGIGPLSKLAILREYIQPNTEKILWFHYEGNDFEDLFSELNNKILVEYFDINYTQNLRNLHYLIDNYHDDYKFEKLRVDARNIEIDHNKIFFKVLSFIKLAKTRKIILRNIIPKKTKKFKEFKEFKEFKKIINLAKIQSEKNNSKLYFIYLPSYSRYKNKVDNTNYENVKKIISDLDIEFIDIHKEVFINEKNPLKLFPFGLPGHYNEIGYKRISEKIFNLLN